MSSLLCWAFLYNTCHAAATADLKPGSVAKAESDLSLRQEGISHAGALAHYTTALQLESAGKQRAALEHFLAVAKAFPQNAEVVEHTAGLLMQYHGREAAMKLLEETVDAVTDGPQALILLARFATTYPPEDLSQKDDRAAQALATAKTRFPRHAEVYAAAVMHHLTSGKRDVAISLMENAAKLPVTEARFWLDLAVTAERVWPLGQIELRAQHLPKVTLFFDAALKHATTANREEIQLEVAQHYLMINELSHSRELCERLAADHDSLPARKVLYRLYQAAGESDKALATLEKVVQQAPEDAEHRRLLAKEYEEREQPEKAIPHLEVAIQRGGGEIGDYLALALQLGQTGKMEPMIHLCERAMRLYPEHPNVHYFLGYAYLRTRQPAKAAPRFADAEKFAAEFNEQLLRSSFYDQFGTVLDQLDRHDEAARMWEKAISLSSPDDPKAASNIMNSLAYMWVEQGKNLDKAGQLLAKANELAPNTPAYIDSLGWLHFKKGDFAKALAELQRAEKLLQPIEPEDAEILEHIAHTHQQLGDHAQALDYMERAAALKSPITEMRERIAKTLRQWKGLGDTEKK